MRDCSPLLCVTCHVSCVMCPHLVLLAIKASSVPPFLDANLLSLPAGECKKPSLEWWREKLEGR